VGNQALDRRHGAHSNIMSLPRFDLASAPLDEGTVLLEASAGTGKTYTLVGILLRLLLEKRIERLDQALVVTFTIAATEELKNRLRAGLVRTLAAIHGRESDPFFAALGRAPDAQRILRTALDDFDQASIATIHGFCKRLLDESAFESHQPFHLDFSSDPLPMYYRAAQDTLRGLYEAKVTALGSLLHVVKMTPKLLVEHYRLWQRYPDVQFKPSPANAEPFLRDLETSITAAAAAFDSSLVPHIAAFAWYSGKSPFPDPEADLRRLQSRLATEPALCLGELAALAPESVLKRTRQNKPNLDHPFFLACGDVGRAFDRAREHLRAQLLLRMHERLEADKRRDHVLTFQDLLERTHAALQDRVRSGPLLHALRQRYRTALIDEFQDTDSQQYGIFSTCFAERPLFLVGDPKQSIYGFRGADLRTYLAAREDAVSQNTLDTNYRSSSELVQAVNLLFGGEHTFVQEGILMPPVTAAAAPGKLQLHGDPGTAFQWRYVPASSSSDPLSKDLAEECIATDVASEISRLLRSEVLLDDRPLRPHHIAVLTRTNRQAVAVQGQLRDAGIMSAIGKAGDVFETEELVELERLLLAILQPGNLSRARAAMATRLWGFHAEELAALDRDEQYFDRELLRLNDWRRLWIRRGFVVMKEQFMADLQVQQRLLRYPGGERRLTNLQQLFELLHDAEHTQRLSPEGLFEWLQHERRHKDELDYQLRELRLESDDDAVQILTVHGSKGLEYEVVFCPFLWDARSPKGPTIVPEDQGRELIFQLQKSMPEWHEAEEERLAEDVRLCYVALTRARRRCYVHWGAIGSKIVGSWQSALSWLLSPHRPSPRDPKTGKLQIERIETWSKALKDDLPDFPKLLTDLVVRSGGLMQCYQVPEKPEVVPCPAMPGPTLRALRRPGRRVYPQPLHSFSSLTADAPPGDVQPDVADGATARAPREDQPAEGIFAFARGAAAGQCLHAMLEHTTDLRNPDAELVRSTLAAYGMDTGESHAARIDPVATVVTNLRDLAAARTNPGGPTIGTLCGGARLAEWQFTLPMLHSPVRYLAAAFATCSVETTRLYAPRLYPLQSRTLRGFLTGFVDLLAEHEGRYWVIDWKSNHLGNRLEDYHQQALTAAMYEHDYVLQYHLYVLALHRHLRARLPDYDYERHVGGVCYAFLRGALPDSTNGMFYDRVPFALVEQMDLWADGKLAEVHA
jgi:exodeoxyribonuclease V beta subunit